MSIYLLYYCDTKSNVCVTYTNLNINRIMLYIPTTDICSKFKLISPIFCLYYCNVKNVYLQQETLKIETLTPACLSIHDSDGLL